MTDLESRIFLAIAKSMPTKQPAAVLKEIERTHVIVPKELAERATKAGETGGNAAWERSSIVASLAGYYNDPIRHSAAESDTPE